MLVNKSQQPLSKPQKCQLQSDNSRTRPVRQWISLYQNGSSTTQIAKQYGVVASTVSRNLGRHIALRDRLAASIAASTKHRKAPFSGDGVEGAFLAGLVEDFHVRNEGRLIELSSSTTHPALRRLFHQIFEQYGHPTSRPGYHPRGYYQYYLSVYLHNTFEPFVEKSEEMPIWIPRSASDSMFQSYLSGLIAAEGCIRLYEGNSRAQPVLHITMKKSKLLRGLSSVIGGNVYEVSRAWRLVRYGRAAVELLRCLDIRHQEKVEKARLVVDHAGERWSDVLPLWQDIVSRIRHGVHECKAQARRDYIRKHGAPHPSESSI
jgi:hypothetical protein